ncbi:periostin [Lingula anatina]|uniref:Periostin n=1 Tax=Lingula anatina TaxID=7574 RepID=A0A1S3HKJ8_LINAN|nr:periostin [Lingula anatina]|eukprot:XP_013385991.1 periostin [Lingula anatina]
MASFRCLILLGLLILGPGMIECQNKLKQRIENDQRLRRFKELLETSRSLLLDNYLNGVPERKYTVFAPTDAAWDKLPEIVQNNLRDVNNAESLDKFLRYHIIKEAKIHTTEMANLKYKETMESNKAKVFFNMVQSNGNQQGGYFVNQAKIIQPNTDAENGYLHIIDEYLFPMGSTKSMSGYISQPESQEVINMGVLKFQEMMNALPIRGPGGLRDQLTDLEQLTVFVPTNEALSTIPTAKWDELMADTTKLEQVVASHVIPNKVYFSSIVDSMGEDGVQAVEGRIVGRTIANDVFIKSNNIGGRVVLPDITVDNGVFHMVDHILNFTYFNIYAHISQERKLQQLAQAVISLPGGGQSGTGVQALLEREGEELTLFAPVDSAFQLVDTAVNLKANVTLLDIILKLHIVRQQVAFKDLTNTTVLNSVNSKKLRFVKGNNGTFVIGERIKAKIIEPDVGVTNGIIHYIDNVMGIATKNLKQELDSNDALGYMNSVLITAQTHTDLLTDLSERTSKYTMFVPSNIAWETLYNQGTGKSLIDKINYRQNLVWVLQRHMVKGQVIYSDSSQLQTGVNVELNTVLGSSDIGKITVKKLGQCTSLTSCEIKVLFKGAEARVIEPDIETTNGVIHIIDKVLIDDPADLLRGAVSSTAWIYASCITTILVMLTGLLLHL